MKSSEKLRGLFGQTRPKGPRWSGLLGDFAGNIDGAQPNTVLVRLRQAGGSYTVGEFELRGGLRRWYNLPVYVEVDPRTGDQYVAGLDDVGAAYGEAAGNTAYDPGIATLPQHSYTQEWHGDDELQQLHTLQIFNLRVGPADVFKSIVVQAGVWMADGEFKQKTAVTTTDLTPYWPISGTKWVLIYLAADGAVTVQDDNIVNWENLNPPPPSGYALAAVQLITTATAWTWPDDFLFDVRFTSQDTGGQASIHVPWWYVDGPLAVINEAGGVWRVTEDLELSAVVIYLYDSGASSSTIVDVDVSDDGGVSWTTLFTTPANRPTLAGGATDKRASGTPDTTDISEGDLLRVNIYQVAVGARGLSVQLQGVIS